MKTKTCSNGSSQWGFNPITGGAHAGQRVGRSSSSILSLLLVAAAWFGPGWGIQRCAAQFPAAPETEITNSMGVFRIIVNTAPDFTPLVAPAVGYNGYPGYHSSDHHLTSPVLVDANTTIAVSMGYQRGTVFPPSVPLGNPTFDTVTSYSDYNAYGGIPFLWATAPPPTREVLTEIASCMLKTESATSGQTCSNPMVAPGIDPGTPMVTIGTGAGVASKSPGIVQANSTSGNSADDFPARSFFDVFVQVTLPRVASTYSQVAFPPGGAVLINTNALLVTNLDLGSLPPEVVYIHGNTNAVLLVFRDNNPPYWNAGDPFGYLVLSGHGTFTDSCSSEAALVAAALGTPTDPAPEMPVPWFRTTALFPTPGSSYESLMTDTNPPAGSDMLVFNSSGGGVVYGRDFVDSGFPNPITLPAPNSMLVYTDAVMSTFQVSFDQTTWYAAQATGTVSVVVSNTTPAGSSLNTYATEITQMNLDGTVPGFGNLPLMLRASPTLPSLGQHTVQPDPRGYRISSFFDVFTELSTDGGTTWVPADRSIRMTASAPPPAPGPIFITKTSSTQVTLQWLGNFTLQSTPSLSVPFTDVPTTTGPLLNSYNDVIGSSNMFYRIRQ